MSQTPRPALRRCLPRVGVLALLALSGCIVAPTPNDEATEAGAADATSVDRGTERLDGGPADAQRVDALTPDAQPPQADCVALCAARDRDLAPQGGCPIESFRTPGISYDCAGTCALARAWQPVFARAAVRCMAEEYLCFETLDACAVRRSEVNPDLALAVEVTLFGPPGGVMVGISGVEVAAMTAITDLEGRAEFYLRLPVQALVGFGLQLWVDDGDGRCDLRTDRFALAFPPDLAQIGGEPEAHPLASGVLRMYLTDRAAQWLRDADLQLPDGCTGFP